MSSMWTVVVKVWQTKPFPKSMQAQEESSKASSENSAGRR